MGSNFEGLLMKSVTFIKRVVFPMNYIFMYMPIPIDIIMWGTYVYDRV